MRNKKTVFLILWLMSILGFLAVLPYALTLDLPKYDIPMTKLILVTAFNSAVIYAIAIWFGLGLADRLNLNLNMLYGVNYSIKDYFFIPGISGGIIAGISIFLIDYWIKVPELLTFARESTPHLWKGALASLYGGINEEVLSRLLIMSFISFALSRFTGYTFSIYGGMIGAALFFGLAHLPATAAITTLTFTIILRALLLNGVAGIVFGFLFWKKGLETAMLAHFVADLLIHVFPKLF